MKMFNVLSGLVLLAVSFFTVGAQADTVVNCAWTQTGYTYIGSTAVQIFTCMDGSTAAAVRRTAANGGSYCDISASSGYYTAGPCSTATVYKVVASSASSASSSSVAACAKVGQSITVAPDGYGQIAAFCGNSCSFWITGYTTSSLTGTCVNK